jgi:hypothetical protein
MTKALKNNTKKDTQELEKEKIFVYCVDSNESYLKDNNGDCEERLSW